MKTSNKVDFLLVEKAKRKLSLFQGGEVLKTYTIALGFQPLGHKQFEGDGKTPEGEYIIDSKNPNSAFHLNLGISYPNEADLRFATERGKSAGGAIKIHGQKNGSPQKEPAKGDWTAGCIAVSNEEMEEIYATVSIGTRISIEP